MKNKHQILWLVSVAILIFLLVSCQKAPVNDSQALTPTVEPAYLSVESKVVPARKALLSFSVSGVVEEVIVAEGHTVNQGDLIARLKGSESLSAAVAQSQYEVLQAQHALDELHENANLEKARAEQVLAEAQMKLKTAKEARESKNYQQASKNTLEGLRADFILAQDELKNAEDNYAGFKDQHDYDTDRAEALLRLSEARRLRDRALKNLNTALSRPDPKDVAKADGEVSRAQAFVEKAQQDYEKVKDGPDPDQLKLAQSNLMKAEADLKSAEAGLQDITIKAPFDGVIASNGLKIGQFTSPEISQVSIGDTKEWQIETTDLKESEIELVRVGQRVLITVDAYPDLEFFGTVDRVQTFGKDKQGDIVYKAIVIFEQIEKPLFWNMTAAIHVLP